MFVFSKLTEKGEIIEQLSNRTMIFGGEAFLCASELYGNSSGPRPGYTSRKRSGSWVEFLDKLEKLDSNYDIAGMKKGDIKNLIPEIYNAVKKWPNR